MSRQARVKSETGIYHVMLRGVNKQHIFLDTQDYKKFIQVLIDCKKASHFELYAYCLMNNHIHLLIKETEESVSTIMKRIGCRFVYWYNAKYQRVGHLFQDRFRSEPVETDEYFLCVLRYIHNNPVKAKLVDSCSDYEYSSYNWYFENGILIDKKFALSIMSIEEFALFHQEEDINEYLDISENAIPVTDDMAVEIIKNNTGFNDLCKINELDKERKKELIARLKSQGLSSRQIIMNIGLSKNMVEKVKFRKM